MMKRPSQDQPHEGHSCNQAGQAEQGMLIQKGFILLQKGGAPVIGQSFHSALNKQNESRNEDPAVFY